MFKGLASGLLTAMAATAVVACLMGLIVISQRIFLSIYNIAMYAPKASKHASLVKGLLLDRNTVSHCLVFS
jgi:hypothetical protein